MPESTFEIQFAITLKGLGKPDRKTIEENLQDAIRRQHLNAGWTADDDEDSMVTGYDVEFIYD